MKNYEVLSLQAQLPILKGLDLPSKATFALVRTLEKLESADRHIKEVNKQLCERLSKGTDGNPMTKKLDGGQEVYDIQDLDTYNKEYTDLLNEESGVETFKFDESLLEKVSCSIEQGLILKMFFQEEK